MEEETRKKKGYDYWYKILLFIPIVILIFCLIYLGFFFIQHNNIILKDVSLSGGATITIKGENLNADQLESSLRLTYDDINFRKIMDINSGKLTAVIIEGPYEINEFKSVIEDSLGYKLTSENSNTEFTGPSLSEGFYLELVKLVFLAFILMALVVFLIFGKSKNLKTLAITLSFAALRTTFPSRTFLNALVILIGIFALIYSFVKSKTKREKIYLGITTVLFVLSFIFQFYNFIFVLFLALFVLYLIESVPSIAVIFAAFTDIIFTLTIVDFFGIKLSSAGIAAFLMLIGYSVDTDILLTSRVLKKKEGEINKRIYDAFKTGIMMTLTSLLAVLPAFFLVTGLPESFRQIFLILAIGLFADIFNTWLTNAGIIKWYYERKMK